MPSARRDPARDSSRPGKAIIATVRGPKTRARLELLFATGIAQATFRHLTPADVDFELGTVRLPRRQKGRQAAARVLPLTPAGIRAFKAITRADAWGPRRNRDRCSCTSNRMVLDWSW